MRSKSFSRKYLPKAAIIGILFFTSFLVLATYLALNHFLSIKKVEIISPKKNLNVNGVSDFKYKNLLFISNEKIKQSLKDRNPEFKEIDVEKKYPNSLKLTISFHKPQAAIHGGEGFLILSEDGTIIAKLKENNLSITLINYYQKIGYFSYHVGDKIDFQDILTTLYFIEKTKELGLTPVTVDIDSLDMIALNLKDKRILFTSKKDKKLQLYQLETILRQFKIQGRDYSQMDLRFDKPVIKF